MELNNIVCRVVIPDPLEFIEIVNKRPDKTTGKIKKKRYYLTANIFYGGVHERIRMHIVEQVKWFLKPFIKTIQPLTDPPYSIVLQYCRPKHIDVSNVCFFWDKVICDMLAPPAPKNKGKIKLPPDPNRVLPNDNSNYIDCVGYEYYKTEEHCLVLMVIKN